MAAKKRTPKAYIQYSKKLATAVCIFWMVYRLINFIVVSIRPETATALVDLVAGVDTIMIVNMSAYTGNSSIEKIALAVVARKPTVGKDDDEKEDEG